MTNLITDEKMKKYFVNHGLYGMAKVLLKSLKHEFITEEEYITESKKLFDTYEKLKNDTK